MSGMRFAIESLNPKMRAQVEAKLKAQAKGVRTNRLDDRMPEGKQQKYHAQPTELDGIKFHSKKEAKRWQTLQALESVSKIQRLRRQTRFQLEVNGVHLCDYISDFDYLKDGKLVVEDSKGMRKGGPYELFRVKARLMKALFGIDVQEV